jgi:hypothetical protein
MDDKISVIVLANGATALPGVIVNEVAKRYVGELAAESAKSAN